MNDVDFTKLQGLIAKLTVAANRAATTDDCFKKYHQPSVDLLSALPQQLKRLEQGLRTAKMIRS